MRTEINWQLNNYCTGGCSYCPKKFWGGELPESVTKFLSITEKIINHYNSLDRKIFWRFTGGEPLEFFDLPAVLKLCKENNGEIELHTNGGKLWLDWWAIGPHVDHLHFTYHYWQNPNLAKFIVQAFQKAEKNFIVYVPLRPEHFDEDWNRSLLLEEECGIKTHRTILYREAAPDLGMLPYTKDQLERLFGKPKVQEAQPEQPKTYQKIIEHRLNTSPVFTGKLCNIGIEKLNISAEGWINGSDCNTLHLGNIWQDFNLPSTPTKCIRQSCMSPSDQRITKFD
jgi:hypothetical protein